MSDGGDFGGAAAFLGGLSRGMELGEALGQRSQRNEAATRAAALEAKRVERFASLNAITMEIGSLHTEELKKGLSPEQVQRLTHMTVNLQTVRGQAHTGWMDDMMQASNEGAGNPYFQEHIKGMFASEEQLMAQHADELQKMYQVGDSLARQYHDREQTRTQDESLAETTRSNRAGEQQSRAQLAEQVRGNNMNFQVQTEGNDIQRQQLEHEKLMDSTGTFAQRSEAVARSENTSQNWAGVRQRDQGLTLEGLRDATAAAIGWAASSREDRRDTLAAEHWTTDFEYSMHRDAVSDSFTEAKLALDKKQVNGELDDRLHGQKMAELGQDLREKMLELETKKHDEMLAFNKEAHGDDVRIKEEDLSQQQERIDVLKDETKWRQVFDAHVQRKGHNQRAKRLNFDEASEGRQSARDDARLLLESERVKLSAMGFDLEKVRTAAEIHRFTAAQELAEKEYDDLGDGVTEKVFTEVAQRVNERANGPGGQEMLITAGQRLGLSSDVDSEEIKMALTSEEANLQLDEIRAAKLNEEPVRKQRQKSDARERGLKADKLRAELIEINRSIEGNPERGILGRFRGAFGAGYEKERRDYSQVEKARERKREIEAELEAMDVAERDRVARK